MNKLTTNIDLKGAKVVVCDLDGTLCDVEHRRCFVAQKPKDWTGFFEAMIDDTLRQEVVDILKLFQKDGAKIIFVSARPEDYRETTEWWLAQHIGDVLSYEMLIMRESGDGRPDTEVKSDIYEKYLKNLDVIKVIDDRPSVIRMWREKGLDVIDVGKGEDF